MDIKRTKGVGDRRGWDDALFQRHLDALPGSTRGPVVIVDSTGSTNADVADQLRQGAPAGFVILAHEQVSGRGRLDRTWTSPPGAGIAMSIAARPSAPLSRWGWLPLLAGIAVVRACADAGLQVQVKWPNDIVLTAPGEGLRKIGGILVERVDASEDGFGVSAVIGIGVNVDLTADERPTPVATSFRIEGCTTDREYLVARILDQVTGIVDIWDRADGDVFGTGIVEEYRARCSTLGELVRVERPGGDVLVGRAVSLHESGGLEIDTGNEGIVMVTAGDVIHLRH